MIYPECIATLIDNFKKLPGIGEKTAERMAFALLKFDNNDLLLFGKTICELKNKIKYCKTCGILTDKCMCNICSSNIRSDDTLCVVEDSKDVFLFEKSKNYNGKYHVLNGLISPLDGIGPENLNIDSLLDRIKKARPKEIIVAVKSGIEGETTALYIKTILKNNDIKVSKIATGIPIGAEMEYVDSLTLETALKNRKEIN